MDARLARGTGHAVNQSLLLRSGKTDGGDHVSAAGISFLTLLRSRPLLLLVTGAAAIVEYVAAAAGGPRPSRALFVHPFGAIAASSVFFRYLVEDRGGSARKWIVYLSPLAFAPWFVLQSRGVPSPLPLLVMFVALGTLGVIGFVLAAYCAPNGDVRLRYVIRLIEALVLPVGASMLAFGLWSTYRINPVYDMRVYAFETILGPQFSIIGVRIFHLLWPFSAIASGCYAALPLGMMLAAVAQAEPRRQSTVLAASMVAGACGFALYFVCPVVGPLSAFGAPYPHALPAVSPDASLMLAPIGAPRNGMPSLHTVWALLIWFNARPLPVMWRRALRAFAIMNIWAAMGLDDTHWLMDVIVAVPLAVAVQSAVVTSRSDTSRHPWVDSAVCGAMTAMWLIGFRLGRPLLTLSLGAARMAALVTVAWPLAQQWRADLRADRLRARITERAHGVDAPEFSPSASVILESERVPPGGAAQ